MRILALDVGDKRIGVAISDPLGLSAQPLKTILRSLELSSDLDQILSLVAEFGAQEIVVGYPATLKGKVSPQTRKVEGFIQSLKNKTALPVIVWDERLSTEAAHKQAKEMGLSRREQKEKIDQLAASFILEGYLASRKR